MTKVFDREREVSEARIQPQDEFNRKLVENVHPADWQNPEPEGRYNLVVIGAGTAGLISANGAAGLGAKVALIEKHLMGGDCLNVGCVPSKGLIRSARASADVRDAGEYGVVATGYKVDFPALMERMRRLRARISPVDSAHRYKDLGVDVYLGNARFAGKDTIEVNGKTLRFAKAVIATGARAAAPGIPGLAETGYLTNETVFSLTGLPPRLAVIGAGPIGCELSQAFRRFGSEVYLLEKTGRILPREDREAAEVVELSFGKDGVHLLKECSIQRIEKIGSDKVIHFVQDDRSRSITVDEILVGIGRAPNVEGLDLETVGVKYDATGVIVNEYLQTSNSRIYAAGDVCFPYKFTHAASAMGSIVVQNSLFVRTRKTSGLTIPWCTYTDPEVAHVGLYEREAEEKGIPVDSFTQSLEHVDRAILDGEEQGFVKVVTKKGTPRILGATVVARHAGEMISEITLAMKSKTGLSDLAYTIHPYPTQAESISRVGFSFLKTRLTPTVQKIMRKWLAWRR
jgi:mercury(II) reductase